LGTILDARPLVPHPDTPARRVTAVTCSIAWEDVGHWRLDFIVVAPPDALRLPGPAAPERTDGLWQHSCFELFLRAPDDSYLELNFSPSGQWAAYRFDGYRAGMRDLELAQPRILTIDPAQPARFALSAQLSDSRLSGEGHWCAGVSAVIEEIDGTKSYWALAHPPGKPDFHHPDCFVLELPPAG
jgi:hypothetical protein